MKLNATFSFLMLILNVVQTENLQKLQPQNSIEINAFRFYKEIRSIAAKVPTVVEVVFPEEYIERFDFAVFDMNTKSFQPYLFKQETLANEITLSISTTPPIHDANKMIDKDTETYTQFLLPEDREGQVEITLSSDVPITSSVLTILLDNNVALPNSIEIKAFVNNKNIIVVNKRKIESQTILFPKTTSNKWRIIFTFSQPLRICELRLKQENAVKTTSRVIRFLAHPGHSYRIYFDPDRSIRIPVGEAGDLNRAENVMVISSIPPQKNPNYIIADSDNDGVPDIKDNCVSNYNPEQKDINNNGRGDVCDDWDLDGIINSQDNCPDQPNRYQEDQDNDGIGDACDEEESRVTERFAWIPWGGIGFAIIVLLILFIFTARTSISQGGNDNK